MPHPAAAGTIELAQQAADACGEAIRLSGGAQQDPGEAVLLSRRLGDLSASIDDLVARAVGIRSVWLDGHAAGRASVLAEQAAAAAAAAGARLSLRLVASH